MAKKRKSETPAVASSAGIQDHKAPRNFISAQADPSTPMFRVVVKANLSMPMADNLVASIAKSFEFLDAHGAGFNSHPHHAHQPHHKAC